MMSGQNPHSGDMHLSQIPRGSTRPNKETYIIYTYFFYKTRLGSILGTLETSNFKRANIRTHLPSDLLAAVIVTWQAVKSVRFLY